jgi:beta-galactosidase
VRANRRDVSHVIVRVTDAAGNTVPTADNRIHLELVGEGRLIGLDNGKPDDHTDYRSNERAAFNGLCLAIVRATSVPGRIKITASSPELSRGQCEIRTEVARSADRAP